MFQPGLDQFRHGASLRIDDACRVHDAFSGIGGIGKDMGPDRSPRSGLLFFAVCRHAEAFGPLPAQMAPRDKTVGSRPP